MVQIEFRWKFETDGSGGYSGTMNTKMSSTNNGNGYSGSDVATDWSIWRLPFLGEEGSHALDCIFGFTTKKAIT